jgi:hypothetical protein
VAWTGQLMVLPLPRVWSKWLGWWRGETQPHLQDESADMGYYR